jgi:TrmH family RNA methyltransferase
VLAYSHLRVRRLRRLLQKRATRWSERVFVAEGVEVVRCGLEAGSVPESLFVAEGAQANRAVASLVSATLERGSRVFPLAPGVAGRVADTVTPHPVFGIFSMTDVEFAQIPRSTLAIACVDVRDPGNLGTVLRTCDAAGVDVVVCCGGTVDPYNPKTVRASAGSLFHVPFTVQADPVLLATTLAAAGYRTLATMVREGDDYAALDWSVPTALFLGNESAGLRAEVVEAMGGSVVVPMEGRAESLNVGMACAVICFEALRQRRGRGAG